MNKIDVFSFRVKRRLLTGNIPNNVVRTKYQQLLTYNYLMKKYKSIIDNSNYKLGKKKENKTVWICWLQGLENAPEIIQKCHKSVCKAFKGYEVIVITSENYKKYTNVPQYIIDKWEKGIISNTHFSDVLRIELLSDRGGVWIDSTVYCTANEAPKYLSESDLFVFKELDLNRADTTVIVASNWFIKANPNNPIVLLTRDLVRKYWEENNTLIDYFFFHLFFAMATHKYNEIWEEIPIYNNINPHIMQFELKNDYNKDRFEYYKKISDFHKLTYKLKSDEISKKSNYNFILGELNEKNK